MSVRGNAVAGLPTLCRAAPSSAMTMIDLLMHVRHGVRLLLKAPGFTAAATLTLALGIGVNTTMFTVVHGVLLKDLPYPEPQRLMRLVQAHNRGDVTIREFEF